AALHVAGDRRAGGARHAPAAGRRARVRDAHRRLPARARAARREPLPGAGRLCRDRGARPGAARDAHRMSSARKRRASKFLTVRIVNPLVRRLASAGLAGPSVALLETTGRKSGQKRVTPVGNGLRGDVFWIVTEHGWASAYVKNIQADPRVRVKVGR